MALTAEQIMAAVEVEGKRIACEEMRVEACVKDLAFHQWLRIGEEDGRALLDKREVSAEHQLAYDTGYLKGSTSRKEWCQAYRWHVEARIAAGWVGGAMTPDIGESAAHLAAGIVNLDWKP